jgi:sugar (pentulose or hexulose) kinase
MCEILATILQRPLKRLQSDEGPALGAAVVALSGIETYLRRQQGRSDVFSIQDAVHSIVKYREIVPPNPAWHEAYVSLSERFEAAIGEAAGN